LIDGDYYTGFTQAKAKKIENAFQIWQLSSQPAPFVGEYRLEEVEQGTSE
jgi:hypothetical protein